MCEALGTMAGGMGMMGGMGLWMILWVVLGLIAAGLVVGGAVWLGRTLLQRKSPQLRTEGPREVLQKRYAAGEIDEDEYLRRMSGLEQS